MENIFKLPQNSSSNSKITKRKNNTIDPKNQNQTQASKSQVGGIVLPQHQASKALNDGIVLLQLQTSKVPKTLIGGIQPPVSDLTKFSQTVQELQSPIQDLEIEEINGIEGDKNEIMDDNFTLNNQTARPESNPQYLKIYIKFNVAEILNNWFMYEKTSDYKKLIKINRKIEKYNDSDDNIQKDDGKLPIKEYEFHLQQVAKIMEKLKKNDQDIEAWQE